MRIFSNVHLIWMTTALVMETKNYLLHHFNSTIHYVFEKFDTLEINIKKTGTETVTLYHYIRSSGMHFLSIIPNCMFRNTEIITEIMDSYFLAAEHKRKNVYKIAFDMFGFDGGVGCRAFLFFVPLELGYHNQILQINWHAEIEMDEKEEANDETEQ